MSTCQTDEYKRECLGREFCSFLRASLSEVTASLHSQWTSAQQQLLTLPYQPLWFSDLQIRFLTWDPCVDFRSFRDSLKLYGDMCIFLERGVHSSHQILRGSMTPHMSRPSATRTITRTFSTCSFQVFEPFSFLFNLNIILDFTKHTPQRSRSCFGEW